MAKSIKELRKENTFLKGKTEKSDYTLVQLVEEVSADFTLLWFYFTFYIFWKASHMQK